MNKYNYVTTNLIESFLQQFGKLIKAKRKASKLTQRQVSDMFGCSMRHIQSIESGEGLPSLKLFLSLVKYFDININEYLGIDNLNLINSEPLSRILALLANVDFDELIKYENVLNTLVKKKE